mgnify:CR=1 FL=1
MIEKLVLVNGDYLQLKSSEKRSYKSYLIENIKNRILTAEPKQWKSIIREHILANHPSEFGANVMDIYLIAYVAENFGAGKERFFKYVFDKGISGEVNSAQAIWQVGKGDGVYLDILNDNGTVKDWIFMKKWVAF